MRLGAFLAFTWLACDAQTPTAPPSAPTATPPVPTETTPPAPAPASAPPPSSPAPEPAKTKVVAIEPWGLEITLPESAGHVFDPANQWFHADLAWEQFAYLKKIKAPPPKTLAQIPKQWKQGDALQVIEEKLWPDGSLSCAVRFEGASASESGKTMLHTVSHLYVSKPLDARSYIECSVRMGFEAGEAIIAANREMCMSLRPVSK
ncbi:hypothetical protein OV090_10495 [Nannocystis sp. RBIL2]|uniref:hypothetical protein n=1 Tax=Nannocystis sp. RBIL2 TaxID=2996788 RepID=UPI00226F221E|nr:hypothetical protein [Nannocystis sp. RBIL2]MCY1065192.1 hypothetical protein [Nannocystis sp. RBIL2]